MRPWIISTLCLTDRLNNLNKKTLNMDIRNQPSRKKSPEVGKASSYGLSVNISIQVFPLDWTNCLLMARLGAQGL